MKKVLSNVRSFYLLGFKKQSVTAALFACLTVGGINITHAASPNTSPTILKSDAPQVYIVKKGDTLWDISGKFLKRPWRWREIWASNKHVKNPHWIYPGDRLLLCTTAGKPLIGRDEGDGCVGIINRYTGQRAPQSNVRVEELNNAIPVIPLDQIKPWLNRAAIVSSENIENTPYILGTADQRVLAGKGQNVYVRGKGLVAGQRYAVYRKGEPYFSDDHSRKPHPIGLDILQVASGVAIQTQDDITTLELTDSYNTEVRRGDLVMIEPDPVLPSLFYPTEATDIKAGAQIVRVMGSIGSAAIRSIVTVNRGDLDGVNSGDVFSIYQQGETVKDPNTKEIIKLPNQKIGSLMVFNTFDHMSYAYVLESSLPIKVGAEIIPPHDDD